MSTAMSSAPPPQGPVRVELTVGHECDVAAVISGVMRLCRQHGLDDVFTAHVATAASELANNLWMHTVRGGWIRLTLLDCDGRIGVEVVAEDDGPGIADIPLALTEGYSTGGGMGCGLPGVQRLMEGFEIDSRPGHGTRVSARKWSRRSP
jgi:serine/threonine-protein kinase RsbT